MNHICVCDGSWVFIWCGGPSDTSVFRIGEFVEGLFVTCLECIHLEPITKLGHNQRYWKWFKAGRGRG